MELEPPAGRPFAEQRGMEVRIECVCACVNWLVGNADGNEDQLARIEGLAWKIWEEHPERPALILIRLPSRAIGMLDADHQDDSCEE